MNIIALLAAVSACLAMVEADKTTAYADDIEPFKTPEAQDGVELTALEFQPYFKIEGPCSSYPAVDKFGVTSKGLPKDADDCKIPSEKSQAYTRGMWHKKRWAQMNAVYIPSKGTNTTWVNVVTFLNNPDVNHQKLLAVSYSPGNAKNINSYKSQNPPDENALIDGGHFKVVYDNKKKILYPNKSSKGKRQPLIAWDQLTKEAQKALNDPSSFNHVQAPFNDANFKNNIYKAWEASGLPVTK
ncbi:unnamed protein product [Peronospora farinosa]|uniref:Uncharacterized protein n=1 Tax=Peronospora farinosa TaxID=134698 RepID=A0AAV0UI04_9STRA|nr:unnamed protein product [Peronospora farinosa]